MIDATTHTRKIWRSHFDGADSICQQKKSKFRKIRKNKKASGEHLYYFFLTFLSLLYTITSSWCGRFDTPCIMRSIKH
jgi:hypothetical protein